jgi:hypothetical protein
MSSQRVDKRRIFAIFDRVPVVRQTGDPVIAGVLMLFALAVIVALALAEDIFPGDDRARTYVVQIAGGFLALFVFYFASINLRTSRAQHYADRVSKAIEQVGSTSDVVRIGAVRLLEGLALEEPEIPGDDASRLAARAYRRAIADVLAEIADGESGELASKARHILASLEAQGRLPRRASERE